MPITPRQLYKKLEGYGIKKKKIRVAFDTLNGFELAQFSDAFDRYLDPQ